MTPTRDISKIGVFHFGSGDKGDPLGSLEQALKEASTCYSDLSDSLIVIPEAFNIRTEYGSQCLPRDSIPEDSIRADLMRMSATHKVALVAGILESPNDRQMLESVNGPQKGYNSAFLIDRDLCLLLSRKISCDGTGLYELCLHNHCIKLFPHRGICVCALICMDAELFQRYLDLPVADMQWSDSFFATLRQSLRSRGRARKILCVPARFSTNSTFSPEELITRFDLPEVTIAISNGKSPGASAIRSRNGQPLINRETNKILITGL